MTPGLGWTLGEYVIGRPIDAGKFGTVYEARHLPTGRDVALKLIPLQGVDGEEKVAAERHGAMLQTRFCQTHRGLVPEVFEHQQIVTFYAIAMEMVHGLQLTDVISAGPMPPRRAASVALAICNFLEKAHSFETEIEGVRYGLIVHADLKPDHILLVDNDEIRVLDFGIAKALAERTLVTTNKWGSVHYASPERLQSDGHVNEHVDFWSLGVMLFEMVAGFRPYRQYEHNASRLDAAIRRQETREPLPVTSDPVLATIVHKLLAPQIERRYASATAISKDLQAFLHGGPVVAAMEAGEASQETVRIAPFIPSAGTAASTSATQAITQAVGSRRGADSPPTEPIGRRTPADAAREQWRLAAEAITAAGARASAAGVKMAREGRSRHGKSGLPPLPPQLAPAAQALKKVGRRRAAKFIWTWMLIGLVASESFGLIRAARFRSQVSGLEIADISRARSELREIGDTPLGFARALRVDDRLTLRMIELADRAILAYRTGSGQVAQAQWEQARDCLDLAAEIAPRNRRVAAKRAYVRGQLVRITAREQTEVDEAVEAFHDAARLDPSSPDPYLGLARIYAYQMTDVDALTEAIHDAEARGYTSGPREKAQIGDAYKLRADRSRTSAARLNGEERTATLESARSDYEKCVESFEDLHFFNSDDNLRTCKRRLDAITSELASHGADEPEPDAPSQEL